MALSKFPETDLAEMLLHATTLPTLFISETMMRGVFAAGWPAMPDPEKLGDALVEDASIRFDVLARYAALADGMMSGRWRTPATSLWD